MSISAREGNNAAGEVSSSMKEITTSSRKIAEITKIIDGIASQTNALALKAGKNGNGNGKKQDVPIETTSNESMIPKGENRIPEHDESFRDF